jgi:hypothetical protein
MMAEQRILTSDTRERLVNAGVGEDDRASPDSKNRAGEERATPPRDSGAPQDAGRTSGGGSSGHRQPRDVADSAPIRNNP